MGKIDDLLREKLRVINIGLESFAESLRNQGAEVLHVAWKPPAGGNERILKVLEKLSQPGIKEKIDKANREAVELIINAQPFLIDVSPASEAIPGMEKNLILHAGPPVSWERMCGPVRGAVMGALIFEGLAKSIDEAEALASSGEIRFAPCHHYGAVGPMAGVTSYSMWGYVVENRTYGNRAFCSLNEGLGKVLRFGAYSEDVIERLRCG